MDTTEAAEKARESTPKAKEPLDPLRRVFVPIEKRMLNGQMTFKTSDELQYFRNDKGVIMRRFAKVNGKKAKKDRQRKVRNA